MSRKRIILNEQNYLVLKKLVESFQRGGKAHLPHVARLAAELKDAVIMDSHTIPNNVVTMHSRVRYRYVDSETTHEAVIVFPAEIKESSAHVSILSPFGMALIGEREGSEVEYVAPGGTYRVVIERVEHVQTV